jgi:hypothetical protein
VSCRLKLSFTSVAAFLGVVVLDIEGQLTFVVGVRDVPPSPRRAIGVGNRAEYHVEPEPVRDDLGVVDTETPGAQLVTLGCEEGGKAAAYVSFGVCDADQL